MTESKNKDPKAFNHVAKALYDIGLAYLKLNQDTEAKTVFLNQAGLAKEFKNKDPKAFDSIAIALSKTQSYKKAFLFFKEAHELDPGNDKYLNNMELTLDAYKEAKLPETSSQKIKGLDGMLNEGKDKLKNRINQ